MAAPPSWAPKAVRIGGPLLAVLLAVQYLVGLDVNLYGPSAGFTNSTSFAAFDAHRLLGYLLGVMGIVLLAAAIALRHRLAIAMTSVILVGIAAAGIAGEAYVASQPNPAIDSFAMAAAFLLAAVASMGLNFAMRRELPMAASLAPTAGPAGVPP